MKILIIMLLSLVGVTSCHFQHKNDVMALPFNQGISEMITTQQLEESQDIIYGIYTYETSELDGFRIGDINLSTYTYPESAAADYNNIKIYADSRTSPQYLGFRYTTVKQDEIAQLLDYLKTNYPEFEQRKDAGGEAYFWDITALDAWLFYYPSTSVARNEKEFLHSNFLFVKKGTRMENSRDTSYNTILDNFNMMYPVN